jgi:hypothetical protein
MTVRVSLGRKRATSTASSKPVEKSFWVPGGSTAGRVPQLRARATAATVTGSYLEVELANGHTVRAPLTEFPRLQQATPAQRRNYRLLGDGTIISWPDVDEDIEVAHLLLG